MTFSSMTQIHICVGSQEPCAFLGLGSLQALSGFHSVTLVKHLSEWHPEALKFPSRSREPGEPVDAASCCGQAVRGDSRAGPSPSCCDITFPLLSPPPPFPSAS